MLWATGAVVDARLLGGQGLAARFVPNAWWLQVIAVIAVMGIFGVLIGVVVGAFRARRRANSDAASLPGRLERGGPAIAAAVVCLVVLVAYFVGWHTNTRLLGTPGKIDLPSGATYVAMGDSYAAGEGLPRYNPGFRCHQSVGGAFAKLETFTSGDVHLAFVACSGATLADIASGVTPSSLTRGNCSGIGATQVCEPLQLPRVHPEHNVALTTIIISGNDADWSSVLPFCATHSACQTKPYQKAPTLAEWATSRVNDIRAGLDKLFPLLKQQISGRILVLGYPPLFGTAPRQISAVCNAMAGLLPRGETTWFRAVEQRLDDEVNQAATAAHLEYIATDSIFSGHEPCSRHAWINALTAGEIRGFLHGQIKLVGSGSFHPTNNGQLAFATIVSCYMHEHKNPPPTDGHTSTWGDSSDHTFADCVASELNAKGVPADPSTTAPG
ncbi:MAG TPA: hypothetical protein VGP92_09390 [Acidimicrobiia bacterium]|nr:hypothetical protein [Acidimicrobiia bacterium]